MKKKGLIIIVVSIIFCISFIYLIISNIEKNKTYFLTIKKSYSIIKTSDENKELIIDIYTNNVTEEITNINRISEVYLTNNDNTEKYLLSIENIEKTGDKIEYKNVIYEKINFVFNFIIESDSNIIIKDAILIINYVEDEIKINIGSVGLYIIPYYGDIQGNVTVSRLKGIVNEINGVKKIVGIVIGLKNHSKMNIFLNNIEALSPSVCFSIGEMISINPDIKNTSDISSLLGYDYDLNGLNNGNIDKILPKEKEVFYLIPLKYLNNGNEIVDSLGINIDLGLEGNLYNGEFRFFSSVVSKEEEICITSFE